MRHVDTRFLSVLLAMITLLVGACAPAGAPTGTTSTAADRPVAKKVLTLADAYEPLAITETFIGARQSSGNNVRQLAHDGLTMNPVFGVNEPQLAMEIPSVERGSWKINADGTMETTWKLRPNTKWHDGHPFTSSDLLFTYEVGKDPDVASVSVSVQAKLIKSVTAPDDLTMVMNWSGPFVDAATTGVGQIVPRHLIEPLYQMNKQALTTSQLFSHEFVGLGPYRLVSWESGSFAEFARFPDYYKGLPPLDTIYMKFIADTNTLVANMLAGAVDAVLTGASGTGVSIDQAMEVKRRWDGTGNQVITSQTGNALWAEAQYRAENAKPPGAVSDVRVRRALLHAMDRASLTDVLTHGLSPAADSYALPEDPRFPALDPFVVKYPYDPAKAVQLLTEAGWARGADGILTRTSDGQRFEMEFWARSGAQEKTAAVITDDWRRIGIAAIPVVLPTARRGDIEFESTRPGFLCCVRVGFGSFYSGKLYEKQITTAANRWTGINYGGYVNPKADAIIDKLVTTIDPKARLPLEQQLVHEYTDQVSIFPMWWEIFPMLMADGIKGPRPGFVAPTENIFEWDKR